MLARARPPRCCSHLAAVLRPGAPGSHLRCCRGMWHWFRCQRGRGSPEQVPKACDNGRKSHAPHHVAGIQPYGRALQTLFVLLLLVRWRCRVWLWAWGRGLHIVWFCQGQATEETIFILLVLLPWRMGRDERPPALSQCECPHRDGAPRTVGRERYNTEYTNRHSIYTHIYTTVR